MSRLVFVALIFFGFLRNASSYGDGYLDILKDAQIANAGRYTHGELRATYRKSQIGQPTFYEHHDIHVIWSEGKIWSRVKRWTHHLHEVDPRPGTEQEHLEYILNDGKLITYHPGGKRVIISPVVGGQVPEEARMTPSAFWYGPLGFSENQFTWLRILEPSTTRTIDASKIHFSIKERSGDLIEVFRHEDQYGGDVRMVFSLSQDGNVVEYEFNEPVSKYSSKGTCEWNRDAQGRLFLTKSAIEEISEFEGQEYTIRKTYETTFFNPDIRIDPARFEMKSLKLPPGVTIDDEINGRRRRTGDTTVESVVDRLGPLIETMQSRGFSSRTR